MGLDNIVVGPRPVADGGVVAGRAAKDGSFVAQDGHGRYTETAYRGNVFSLSVAAAAAINAYTGAAAGTPQIALWNPANSGKIAALLSASFANVVAASAAGTVAWQLFFGQTAAITQATVTAPFNHSTLNAAGSAMKGFTNVALTSSTALTNAMLLGYYYWATAAGAFNSPTNIDLGGLILVPPGCMAALGGSAALTSATWIGNLIWEEIPV